MVVISDIIILLQTEIFFLYNHMISTEHEEQDESTGEKGCFEGKTECIYIWDDYHPGE